MSATPSSSWWSRLLGRFRSTPEPVPIDPTLVELSIRGESPLTTPGPDSRRAPVRYPNSRCPRAHTQRRPDVRSIDLEAEVAARIDALVDAGALDEGGLQALERQLAPVVAQQTDRLDAQFAHAKECYLHLRSQLAHDIADTSARLQHLHRDITDLDRSYVHARDTLLGTPSTVGWAAAPSTARDMRDPTLGDRFTHRTSHPSSESPPDVTPAPPSTFDPAAAEPR